MCLLKPDGRNDLGDDDSDEEGAMLAESDSDDSDEESDEEDIADVGEEPGKAEDNVNPFYKDSDEDSDVSDDSEESEDDESEKKSAGDEIDEEDELVKALKNARQKKERVSPPDIKSSELLTDLSFHPESEVVVVGNITGDLSIFNYSNESNQLAKKLKLSNKALRGVEFDGSGKSLLTISKDRTFRILDTETWAVRSKHVKCHDSSLYSVYSLDENLSVTGDEDGFVKMWDARSPNSSVMTFKRFDEYVSSFLAVNNDRVLIAGSGEGTIQSFDLRTKKPDVQSEVYEGELNCLGTVRSGTKLVVGSGLGTLYLFSEGQFGLHSDQYPGHPDGINCLLPVTDNVVITGCEDGHLRAVHLYPHRFLGVVGHHEDQFPIEKLDVNSSGEYIASLSHDNRVKFWNVSYLEEMDYEKTKKPGILSKSVIRSKNKKLTAAKEAEHQLPSSGRSNKADFFSGFKE